MTSEPQAGSLLDRLSLNQATIRRADLRTSIDACRTAGIPSIGVWLEPVREIGFEVGVQMLADSGLRISAVCRTGYVTSPDVEERRAALDECRRAIDEVAALTAAVPGSRSVLVFVTGALVHGDRSLPDARERARESLAILEPNAQAAGVTLAVEALHPMYAADLAIVSTLGQALDLVEPFGPNVGVVIDSFHTWWDVHVMDDIARAGREGRIASFQVSDWITPLPSPVLVARGMMGQGHIDFPPMVRAVLDAGWTGDIEVEIFNEAIWAREPVEVAREVRRTFRDHVIPAGESSPDVYPR